MADQRDVDVKIDGNRQADPHKQQASSAKGKAQSTDNQESKPLIVPEGLSLDQRDPQGLHDEDHSDLKVNKILQKRKFGAPARGKVLTTVYLGHREERRKVLPCPALSVRW